ncbi:MAG TPA: hypothetical protein VII51_00985 [Gaiellaceae bacterium]
MTAFRLGVAGCLVAVAVLVALLAADVRSWRDGLAGGDAVFAVAPARASWAPATKLGGVAEDLLGIRGDVTLRSALQLYVESTEQRQRLDNALDVQTSRARAQDALAGAALDADASRAGQAEILLGVLAFGAYAQGAGPSQIDAAISDFTDAIRTDPGNTSAAFDLELLLRLTVARGIRTGEGVGGGFGRTGRHGAGGGIPGSGY